MSTPEDDPITYYENQIRYLIDIIGGDDANGWSLVFHECENLPEPQVRALLAAAVFLMWQHGLAPGPTL